MKRGADSDLEVYVHEITPSTTYGYRDRKRLRTPDEDGKLDGIPLEAQTEPVQYHCDHCSKDISNTVKFRCAECSEFELCVECFSAGVELKGHRKEHSYRIIDNMHFPFFENTWSADEEMLLLEGLETYGIGNWRDIADHVSTKDHQTCSSHYTEYYQNSPEWPELTFEHNCLATRERVMLLNSGKYNKLSLAKEPVTKAKPSKNSDKANKAEQTKNPIDDDLSGYMPLRGEFDTEWDHGAENKIKDLIFDDDDDDQEEKKLDLLECYYKRVVTRKKRGKFVVEKRLHDTKYQIQLAQARSKEANEIHNQGSYKKFLQILSTEEYEEYLQDLVKQQQLELQAQRLQRYRQKGITSMLEANQYEDDLRRREQERNKKYRKHKIAQPVNMEGQPGFGLLSKSEQELCQNFFILPQQFLLVKEAFISEYVKSCDLAKNTALQLTEMEVDKAAKIFDFMQEVGWINNRGHLAVATVQRNSQQAQIPQVDKEQNMKQDAEEKSKEEQPKPQPLAAFLKKPTGSCAQALPLRFGAGGRTTKLFKWPRA